MGDEIPLWAIDRAKSLCDAEPQEQSVCATPSVANITSSPRHYPGYIAFARYIAEHEEPPVDPLLVEAREIASQVRRSVATDSQSMNGTVSANIRAGKFDDHQLVKAAHRALRRGMELASERQS